MKVSFIALHVNGETFVFAIHWVTPAAFGGGGSPHTHPHRLTSFRKFQDLRLFCALA